MRVTAVFGYVTFFGESTHDQWYDNSHNVCSIVGVTHDTISDAIEYCIGETKQYLASDFPTQDGSASGMLENYLQLRVVLGDLSLEDRSFVDYYYDDSFTVRNILVSLAPVSLDGSEHKVIYLNINPDKLAHLDLETI